MSGIGISVTLGQRMGRIFFHRSNLDKGNFNTLEEGTPVEFQVVDGLTDPQAWSIKAINSSMGKEQID